MHDEEAPEDAMAESPKERERRQTARARFPDVDQYNMPLLHSKRWAHNKMFLNFQVGPSSLSLVLAVSAVIPGGVGL